MGDRAEQADADADEVELQDTHFGQPHDKEVSFAEDKEDAPLLERVIQRAQSRTNLALTRAIGASP